MTTAYQGHEPYIFISYSHSDSDAALKIIKALSEAGFRVWYDNGIEAGTEWPEYIAERLMSCGVVIALMSKNAQDSHNCRREIHFALELKKELLVVYLEEVALSPGMRLQLSALQAMFRYKHQNEEDFLSRLCAATLLQSCKNPEEPPRQSPASPPAVTDKPLAKEPARERSEALPLQNETQQSPEERWAESLADIDAVFDAAYPQEKKQKAGSTAKKPSAPSKKEPSTSKGEENPIPAVFDLLLSSAGSAEKQPPATAPKSTPQASTHIKGMRDCLLSAVKACNDSLEKNRSSFSFKTPETFSDKKIDNALSSIAKGAKKEEIVAIMDDTIFGSAKSGYVITEKRLYSGIWIFHFDLPLRTLRKAVISPENKDYIRMTFDDGKTEDFFFSNYTKSFFVFFTTFLKERGFQN